MDRKIFSGWVLALHKAQTDLAALVAAGVRKIRIGIFGVGATLITSPQSGKRLDDALVGEELGNRKPKRFLALAFAARRLLVLWQVGMAVFQIAETFLHGCQTLSVLEFIKTLFDGVELATRRCATRNLPFQANTNSLDG